MLIKTSRGGGLEYLHRSPASRKREPGAWGLNCSILSLGDINTGTWTPRLGVAGKADDLAVYKFTVSKFKDVKTG
jgi:hypothetical protein